MEKHNKLQSEFFDSKTDFTDRSAFLKIELPYYVTKEMEGFFAFAGLKGEPLNILDVACGTGKYTIPLLRRGHRITATDISGRSLAILRERAEEEGLGERLTTDNNSFEDAESVKKYHRAFDRVICVGGVHHFELDKRDAIVMNMAKALKNGGYMVLLEPNPLNPLYYIQFFYSWIVKGTNVRWYIDKNFVHSNASNLKQLLGRCGLTDTGVARYALLPSMLAKKCGCVVYINDFLLKIPLIKEMSAFVWVKGKR